MLITVDEARRLKRDPTFWFGRQKKEYGKFGGIVNLFTVWFMILTLVRSLVVATVIAAMVTQEPDIGAAWENGLGFGFFIGYFLLSCIPVIGNFAVVLAPIGVVIAAFAVGEGFGYIFPTFVIPIILAYVITFGLVFVSNYFFDYLVEKTCPAIFKGLNEQLDDEESDDKKGAGGRSSERSGKDKEKTKGKKMEKISQKELPLSKKPTQLLQEIKSSKEKHYIAIGSIALVIVIFFVWFSNSVYWPFVSDEEMEQRMNDVISECEHSERTRECSNIQKRYDMTFEYCHSLGDIPEIGKAVLTYAVVKKNGFEPVQINSIKTDGMEGNKYPYYGCTKYFEDIDKDLPDLLLEEEPSTLGLHLLYHAPEYQASDVMSGCIVRPSPVQSILAEAIPNYEMINEMYSAALANNSKCNQLANLQSDLGRINDALRDYAHNGVVQQYYKNYDDWISHDGYIIEDNYGEDDDQGSVESEDDLLRIHDQDNLLLEGCTITTPQGEKHFEFGFTRSPNNCEANRVTDFAEEMKSYLKTKDFISKKVE